MNGPRCEPPVTFTSHFGPVAPSKSALARAERVDLVGVAVDREQAVVDAVVNQSPGKNASAPDSDDHGADAAGRRSRS